MNQRPTAYELESTASGDGLESPTTVQELDSSLDFKIQTNLDSTQQNGQTNKAVFTIIHIPDEQSKPITSTEENKSNSFEPFSFTTTATTTRLSIPQTSNENMPSFNEFADQEIVKSVENLDLDLIVKTYEVLQSSDNADVLIKKWLTKCNLGTNCEDNGPTLEENLREFVQFSQKSKNNEQKQ